MTTEPIVVRERRRELRDEIFGDAMMPAYTQSDDLTVLHEPFVRGLKEIRIAHPAGTFAITPASLISLEAIANNQQLLAGVGLDWGSGTGCLAIAAARIPAVQRVIGLELSAANVTVARQNAAANRVDGKATFFESDSYSPNSVSDRRELEALDGQIDFLVANPPASDGDDGFGWRRRVLAGARKYLTALGRVILSVSSQYGMRRVMGLLDGAPGFRYGGVLASTEWVPFDLTRHDLLECLRLYAQEEARGGLSYAFHAPAGNGERTRTATVALEQFDRCGESPLMKWQTHLFEVRPESVLSPDSKAYPESLCPDAGGVPKAADPLAIAVVEAAKAELRECLRMLHHCVNQLSDNQIWSRPDEHQNAIGNLLLHLEGNLRQWIVAGLGNSVDLRNRPAEFAERRLFPAVELLMRLDGCVHDAIVALSNTDTLTGLLKPRRIQGFEVHGVAAIQHSVSHFRGHTQEIIGRTRQLLGRNYRFAWIPKDAEQGS